MSGTEHDVVIVGAGPAGLAAAAALRRLGVDALLIDRRSVITPGSRAIGLHPPSLAALEPLGATERIVAECARITRGVARAGGRVLGEVRFDRDGARYPFVASVPQSVTEAALRAAAPPPARGVDVRAVLDRGAHVAVTASGPDGRTLALRARAVVLASGAAGRALALPFAHPREGILPDRYLMADVAATPEQPANTAVIDLDPRGVCESFPLPGGGRRLVAWDGAGASLPGGEAGAERLRAAIADRTGAHDTAQRIETGTRFAIRRVLLHRMRVGRVFVIGDAAHEVSPIGGQGMNLGLLDATSLAAPLADWLRRPDRTDALERWESARLVSARRAARLADLNTALGRPRSAAAHTALAVSVRAGLATPLAHLAARVYSMGLDRPAGTSP